jgi:hypothetical protein
VIIGAHDTGPLIRSKNGFWLAIPTPAAGKSSKGGRITPGEWERRTGLRLVFIYRRRGLSLLVAEPLWYETGDGHGTTLVVTDAGLLTIGIEPVVAKTMVAIGDGAADSPAPKSPTSRAGTKQAMLITFGMPPLKWSTNWDMIVPFLGGLNDGWKTRKAGRYRA